MQGPQTVVASVAVTERLTKAEAVVVLSGALVPSPPMAPIEGHCKMASSTIKTLLNRFPASSASEEPNQTQLQLAHSSRDQDLQLLQGSTSFNFSNGFELLRLGLSCGPWGRNGVRVCSLFPCLRHCLAPCDHVTSQLPVLIQEPRSPNDPKD